VAQVMVPGRGRFGLAAGSFSRSGRVAAGGKGDGQLKTECRRPQPLHWVAAATDTVPSKREAQAGLYAVDSSLPIKASPVHGANGSRLTK
jgi:hypothetical protein